MCPAALCLTPTDFGTIWVGNQSSVAEGEYDLCICGSAVSSSTPWTIYAVTDTGTNPGDFPTHINTCTGHSFTDPNCGDCGVNLCKVTNIFAPQVKGARSAAVNVYATSYWTGNFLAFNWNLSGTGGAILQPSPAPTNFPMSAPTSTADPGSVTMSFQAQAEPSATVSWSRALTYTSQANVTYTPVPTQTATTTGTGTNSVTYSGKGGQWSITATIGGVGKTINSTISGTQIPDCVISQELGSLYSTGATPTLLEQIAEKESSYQQFKSRALYNVTALWPNESADGALGQYVGLMMVPNSAADAWNWITNCQDGQSTFNGKLPAARDYVSSQQAIDVGLPNQAPTQIEDDVLCLYGGYFSKGSCGSYYWQPACAGTQSCSIPCTGNGCPPGSGTVTCTCSTGWQWQVNSSTTTGCTNEKKYVTDVRAEPTPTPCP